MAEPQRFILPRLMSREGRVASIAKFLLALPIGKNWQIVVTEARSTRSDAQNRYLNGVAYKLIGDATGYERDEVSEYMCGAYWGWREQRVPKKPSNPDGIESVPVRTTTTDETGHRRVLSKIEFADYVAFVQRFAAKKGIYIPDPDPDYAEHQEQVAA
jgi:hypothetical protein